MAPASAHGKLEGPAKSAFSFEKWDSKWELQYMEELEADALIDAWTKNHGIRIPYLDSKAKKREYRPDFLVRKVGGEVALIETKGSHLMDHPDTIAKFDAAKRWCSERGIEFEVVTK
jgi:hypothetical protein